MLQVQNWFQDRQANLAVTVTPSSAHKETVGSKAIVLKKRDKGCSLFSRQSCDICLLVKDCKSSLINIKFHDFLQA